MRISTNELFRQGTHAMLEQQVKLSKTQLQLASGRRLLNPADDPAGTARALALGQAIETTQQFQLNADAAAGRLGLEDNALKGVTNLLQRVRELAVQTNSGALANADRGAIAAELRQRMDELLRFANTQDASGEYLFAGYQSQTQPFALTAAGAVVYNGDQGQRFLQIGLSRQIAVGDSGHAVFMGIRSGNGSFATDAAPANTGSGVIGPGSVLDPTAYQPHSFTIRYTSATRFEVINDTTGTTVLSDQEYRSNAAIRFNGIEVHITGEPAAGDEFSVRSSDEQDIFATLSRLVGVVETPVGDPASSARLAQGISSTLTDLDQAFERIRQVRAEVGARLNAIDSQKDVNDISILQFQGTLSQVQDLDYAEAVSRLNQQLLGLQAAQQSFVRVQGLSLFDLLR
jgi:flagellar hook-associated protein 3 FlgL